MKHRFIPYDHLILTFTYFEWLIFRKIEGGGGGCSFNHYCEDIFPKRVKRLKLLSWYRFNGTTAPLLLPQITLYSSMKQTTITHPQRTKIGTHLVAVITELYLNQRCEIAVYLSFLGFWMQCDKIFEGARRESRGDKRVNPSRRRVHSGTRDHSCQGWRKGFGWINQIISFCMSCGLKEGNIPRWQAKEQIKSWYRISHNQTNQTCSSQIKWKGEITWLTELLRSDYPWPPWPPYLVLKDPHMRRKWKGHRFLYEAQHKESDNH